MAEPRVLLDLGANGGSHWFKDLYEIKDWLDAERARWSWLSRTDNSYGVWGRLDAQYNAFDNLIQDAQAHKEPPHAILASISGHFLPGGQLIHSQSTYGEVILQVANDVGYQEAAYGYALARQWVGIQQMPGQLSYLRTSMQLAMPWTSAPDEIETRLRAERDSFRSASRRLGKQVAEAEEERAEIFKKQAERYRSIVRRGWLRAQQTLRRAEMRRSERADELEQSGLEAIETLGATDKLYKEFMELKAPVDYWRAKANEHKNGCDQMRIIMIIYFILALFGLVGLFAFTGKFLLDQHIVSNTVLFVTGGGLATISGLILWIGRLITRLYLSEHHLLRDAEERAVMTTTYLALTAERAAEENDRKIILAALFRTSSDGVVKDDAVPDV